MNRILTKTGLALLASYILVGPAAARTTNLQPIEGSGLNADAMLGIEILFKQAYQDVSGDEVRLGGSDNELETLRLSAVRISERVTLSGARYTGKGRLMHSVSMPAESDDDIEPVLLRIAEALYRRRSVRATQDIDNVTQSEAELPRVKLERRMQSLSVLFRYPVAEESNFKPHIGVGFRSWRDSRKHFLGYGLGLFLPTLTSGSEGGYGGAFGSLDAGWYLWAAKTSPYFGLSAESRLQAGEVGAPVFTLMPKAAFGFSAFRDTATRLNFQIDVGQHAIPFEQPGVFRSVRRYPTEVGMTISVGI